MKIVYGSITCTVYAEVGELSALRRLLTRDVTKPRLGTVQVCLVSEDNRFPSGLLPFVRRWLCQKFPFEVVGGPPITDPQVIPLDIVPGFVLYPWQAAAVARALVVGRGLLAIPTGGGKTVCYAALLRMLDLPSLTVVGQINHADQLRKKFESYGLGPVDMVGSVFESRLGQKHTIGVAATLSKLVRENDPLFERVKVLCFDEAHHLSSAQTWQHVAFGCPAPYRFGLSATPFEKPEDPYDLFEDLSLIALIGETAVNLSVGFVREQGSIATACVFMQPISQPVVPVPSAENERWTKSRDDGIVRHPTRNHIALELIAKLHAKGDAQVLVLVLVQILEHGEMFVEELHRRGVMAVFLSGNGRAVWWESGSLQVQENEGEWLQRFERGDYRVLIGSVIFDEAVDLPQLTDVVMAGGGKKVRRTRQRVGRVLRGTEPVRVWDFYDNHNHILRAHSKARADTYKADGYPITVGFPLLIDLGRPVREGNL